MTTLFHFSKTFIYSLGYTILHSLWQGLAIVILTTFLFFVLKKQKSFVRYWIGISAFGLQVIASMITFLSEYSYWEKVSTTAILKSTLPQIISTEFLKSNLQNVQLPWYKMVLIQIQLHLDMVVMFWMIGASVLLVRLVVSWLYANQLKNSGLKEVDFDLQKLFTELVHKTKIQQQVQIFESIKILTPMVIGFIKPIVLLPVGLAAGGLTTKQLEAILAHELAHIKRYDFVINIFQTMTEALYFFHPALWWLSSRIRIERENCCDDVAIEICEDKLALAQALAVVESYRQASNSPSLAMAFAAQKNQLLNRIRRVLGVSEKQSFGMNNLVGFIVLGLLLVGFTVYAVQPDDKKKSKKVAKVSKNHVVVSPQNIEVEIENEAIAEKIEAELAEIKIEEPIFSFHFNNSDSLSEKIDNHRQKIDSLNRLMEPNHQKVRELNFQMEKYQFKVEEIERQNELLEWKKSKAQEERSKLTEKRAQLLYPQNGKSQKLNEAEIEKQMAELEQQIKGKETQIQQFSEQIVALRGQANNAQEPIHKLQKEIETIEMENSQYSSEIEKRWEAFGLHVAPPPPPVPPSRVRHPRPVRVPKAVAPPPPPVPVRVPKAVAPPPPPVPAVAPTPPAKVKG